MCYETPSTPVGSLAWELHCRFALCLPYSCHQKSILHSILCLNSAALVDSQVWQGGRERIECGECHLVAGSLCVLPTCSVKRSNRSRFGAIPVAIVAGSLCVLSTYSVKRSYVCCHYSRLTVSVGVLAISFDSLVV